MQEVDNNNSNNNNNDGGSDGRRHPFEGIREVIDTMKVMDNLRPCFEVLESLRIEIMCPSYRNTDTFTILDNGPTLKSVEIVVTRD